MTSTEYNKKADDLSFALDELKRETASVIEKFSGIGDRINKIKNDLSENGDTMLGSSSDMAEKNLAINESVDKTIDAIQRQLAASTAEIEKQIEQYRKDAAAAAERERKAKEQAALTDEQTQVITQGIASLTGQIADAFK